MKTSGTKHYCELQLTENDLEILSDGLLALIQNCNQAAKLVTDKTVQRHIEYYSANVQALNAKICSEMEG